MTLRLELITKPSTQHIATVRTGLSNYNISQVPELLTLPDEEFLVIMRESGQIVAGAVCEFDWGYLYFDTVWTHASVRGKGYGTLVMNAAENYAKMKGIHRAYLMTTSFQARPFYEKLGYQRFGFQQDRPLGHTFHFMQKADLQMQTIDSRIQIESPPKADNLRVLDTGLLDDIAKTEPIVVENLAVFLRDYNHTILGGMVGATFWDWFDLRYLWLDESVRGQGWAKKMLAMTESQVKQDGNIGITCDTASFQSLAFYQSQGFEIIGTLKNRPPQHESYFIQKRFN